MKWIKYIVTRLFDGLLYGMGITVCVVLGVWIAQHIYIGRFLNEITYSQPGEIIDSSTFPDDFSSVPSLPDNIQMDDMDGSFRIKEFDETAMLTIVEHHDRVNADGTKDFLGMLKNEGSDTWRNMEIEVELFDEAGQFLGEYSTFINRLFKPGDTENFQVSGSGCGSHATPEYATYTIRVINALDY